MKREATPGTTGGWSPQTLAEQIALVSYRHQGKGIAGREQAGKRVQGKPFASARPVVPLSLRMVRFTPLAMIY